MFNIIVFVSNKEMLLYPPLMKEYFKAGYLDHEKLPVLEIEPSPHNPMWILVNHLDSDPNADLVSIRNYHSNSNNGLDGKHVTVWVLPKGLGVIDNVWGNEQFISLMKKHSLPNGSNFLTSDQITERVIDIANMALNNGNGNGK